MGIGPAGIDLGHHERSLSRVLRPGAGGIDQTFNEIFPVRVGDLDIEFHGLLIDTPAWRPGRFLTWGIQPSLSLSMAGPSGRVPFEAKVGFIPSFCDAMTRELLPAGAELPAYHDALFVGRPIVPQALLRESPGLHLFSRAEVPQARLVPTAGPRLNIQRTRDSELTVRIEERGTSKIQLTGDLQFSDAPQGRSRGKGRHGSLAAQVLETVFVSASGINDRARGLTPCWFDQDAIDSIRRRLGSTTSGSLAAGDFGRLVALLDRPDRFDSETDLADSSILLYGDLVRNAIITGVLSGFAIWASKRGAIVRAARADSEELRRAIEPYLDSQCERSLERLWATGDNEQPVLVEDDATNTLARIERRRTVTRIGRGGLHRKYFSRHYVRDTHPSYRGVLCPLQSPESVDIGLKRFLALGARLEMADDVSRASVADDEWSDLSVAAALVPFINHNDPARALIGSKNLKQSLAVAGNEPPLIATGAERLAAKSAGVLRTGLAGKVVNLRPLEIRAADGTLARYDVEQTGATPTGADASWLLAVKEGDSVSVGDLLAHAPDVCVDGPGVVLALGCNVVVAYTPWKGLNFEDGIVVSSSLIKRLSSSHVVSFQERLLEHEIVEAAAQAGDQLEQGSIVARIVRVRDGSERKLVDDERRLIRAPERGELISIRSRRPDDRSVEIRMRVRRDLQVGDKLTNRHGGKGIVSSIVPAEDMPCLPNGTRVEAILNPLGVVRRLNIGQLIEANVGLQSILSGEPPQVAGRRHPNLTGLRRDLEALGAPEGRVTLTLTDGSTLPEIVAGVQYMVKLNHQAEAKLHARGTGPRSPRSAQPASGTVWVTGNRIGGAQRAGEMELWCLQALGLNEMLADVLRTRSETDHAMSGTLRSVMAHLRSAGIATHFAVADGIMVDARGADFERLDFDDVENIENTLTRGVDGENLAAISVEDIVSAGRRSRSHVEVARERSDPLRDTETWGEPTTPECLCGIPSRVGSVCDVCRALAIPRTSDDQRRFMKRLLLREPVFHPWLESEVGELLDRSNLRPTVERVGVGETLRQAAEHDTEFSKELRACTLAALPILPYAYRSAEFSSIDKAYREVARCNRRLDLRLTAGKGTEIARARQQLNHAVIALLGRLGDGPADATIAGILGQKRGLLRRGLLGRMTNFSARGVIIPEPSRDPETVGLPSFVLDQLAVGPPIEGDDFANVVVINRQPSLHPYNLIALRAERVEGSAIRINPLLCKALAGDFDGDEVTVHAPRSAAAREEAWFKLRPAANLRSAASGAPLAHLGLDVGLGLLRFTEGVAQPSQSLAPKGKMSLASLVEVNGWGEEEPGPLDSAAVRRLAQQIIGTLPPRQALDRLKQLQDIGFAAAEGWSFSVLPLEVLSHAQVEIGIAEIQEALEALTTASLDYRRAQSDLRMAGKRSGARLEELTACQAAEASAQHDLETASGTLADNAFELAKRDRSLATAIAAGAAGSKGGLAQLVGARGMVPRFDPTLGPAVLSGRYRDGLSNEEYFLATSGALQTLGDKKLLSPVAGNLTKMLVEIGYDIAIGRDDCGIESTTYTERSPLNCLDENPCRGCYGLDPSTNTLVESGARVGILAAQMIGERSTQLTMRTFHSGGTGHGQDLGGQVIELRGLFGEGRFNIDIPGDRGQPLRLEDFFARYGERARIEDRENRASLDLAPSVLLDVFDRLVNPDLQRAGRTIDRVHAAVILRRLHDIYRTRESGRNVRGLSLSEQAISGGIPLLDGSTRGNLRWITEGAFRTTLGRRLPTSSRQKRKTALVMGVIASGAHR